MKRTKRTCLICGVQAWITFTRIRGDNEATKRVDSACEKHADEVKYWRYC